MKIILLMALIASFLFVNGCTQDSQIDTDCSKIQCIKGTVARWDNSLMKCICEEQDDCDSYCKSLPHIMCVGHWEISGTYPDCNCSFICD